MNVKWGMLCVIFMCVLTACGGGGGGSTGSGSNDQPTITLLGANPLTVSFGEEFTDPGATATDTQGTDITESIVVGGDTVDTGTLGTYAVTYDVSDASGNAAQQVTRTVNVIDDKAPEITLLGINPLGRVLGMVYADPGATATDNVDGDVTGSIVTGGDTVDTGTLGTYVVTYDVADASGNAAIQMTRTINVIASDNDAPTITLLGNNPLTVSRGTAYSDPGATATDNVDGDISANIVIGSDAVNTDTQGTYTVTYNVSDSAGNAAAQVTRTVEVVNDAPVIGSLSSTPNPAYVGSTVTFAWDVSDINGDTLTCYLDVNDDGSDDYTIDNCASTASQTHTFTNAGGYTARLTVDDGQATPVEQTTGFSVLEALATDVSVSGPAVAGERLLYTITVGNTSAVPVDDVRVYFFVPDGLSFNISYDAEPNCGCRYSTCSSGFEASWAIGTLAAGETRTITVNPLVDETTLDGAEIVLPVVFSGTDISDIQIDQSVEVYNSPSADLALGASTDPVIPGEAFTYNLDVGNLGATALTGTELRATLPDGVTVSAISDGGTENENGEVVWNIGSLAVGESLHREITVTPDADLTNGAIFKASAQLTHDNGLAVDNTAAYAITVEAVDTLPLQIEIDSSANPVVANDRVIYTMTVGNISQLPVDDLTVMLRVPDAISFYRAADAEPDCACTYSNCGDEGEAVWELGSLAVGETRTITVNALVDDILRGNLITLPIRVTATGLEDTMDLRKTVAVYNDPSADLALGASTDPVVPGEVFTYTLDVGNIGATALTGTELRATLPDGVTVSAISNGGTEDTNGEVVWNLGSMAVGESLHREITVTPDVDLDNGGNLKTSARLTHDNGLAVDNTVEYAVTVEAIDMLPLQIEIDSSRNPVVANDRVIYTMTVGNISQLPVDDLTVMLRVPDAISFYRAADAEPDCACTYSNCGDEGEAVWELGSLAVGETRTITVNALVDDILSGNLITLPIRVTATDLEDTMDLRKTVAVYSDPSTDLALGASIDPVVPGETFTYTLDVGNIGATSLTGTELRATLPDGVTVSAISDGGNEDENGEVVWNIGTMNVGATVNREITVAADSVSEGDILKLSTELSHDGGLENDSRSEFSVTVASSGTSADLLSVDITAAPDAVGAGGSLGYTITLTNNYGLPVDDMTMILRVPDSISFYRAADVEPDCACRYNTCGSEDEAVWELGTLAAGASQVITINAAVDSAVDDGNLIVAPFRVTADGMEDVINLQHVTVIDN